MRLSTAPDPVVVAAVRAVLPAGTVVTPDPGVAAALADLGREVVVTDLPTPDRPDVVLLAADELSAAGDHAESLINAAVASVRPGGWIIASALGSVAGVGGSLRRFRSDELHRALGHAGVQVEYLWAPGAAARIRGDAVPAFDAELDRLPGLLDAAPRLVAAGRGPASETQRSATFFATLPYKVVAASVICRDADGRLLVVHDTFKQQWTLPGGVVDANEDPRSAAVREAWEEAGVRVDAGKVVGVFSAALPDRIVLVYEATPTPGAAHPMKPVHAHEIGEVAWWPLEEALRRLAPQVSQQVRVALENPGATVRQGFG